MSDVWLRRASDHAQIDRSPLTYEPHFGLQEKAFSLVPNSRFFRRHPSNAAAFDELLTGIRRREGILALTGEVGTGKTTLCRAVLAALDRKTFAAFVPDPIVSREDLLVTLLVDFGVVSIDEIRGGRLRNASRTELAYPLYEFLSALQPLNGFAVVMIDEAQDLSTGLLEEIRILSDMENGQKLLQLVLIGQPELEQRLAMPEMRQLTQRLTVRCQLQPLAREEVMPYITHRLSVAGRLEPLFHKDDSDLIWETSEGIPRVINLLCDRALTTAAREDAALVTAAHIASASRDLKLSPSRATPNERESAGHTVAADSHVRRPDPTVEGLSAARRIAPPLNPRGNEDGPAALPASRNLRAFNSELEGAATAELRDPELRPRQAEASRRWTRVAILFTFVTIAAAVGTWFYLSSASGARGDRRSDPTANATTRSSAPAVLPLPQASVRARPPEAPLATEPEPELTAEVIGGKGFAIQMATFSSAQRAAQSVQQLQTSGYKAYDRAVTLRDGAAAHAVFLGPYPTFESASVELERARQLPDYTAGRIVAIE